MPVLRRHDVVKASVFGSYARGAQTDKSDIDFLIDYAPGMKKTLFDLVDLKEELELTLNKNVDLITGSSKVSSYIKDMIVREKQVII
ncbi:MAG: nucleotidyltransferase domain-containing protein [Herbinix sp.]|nr:nucleotidyltransferase domain-containing protein [Herbinix sp.]